MRRSKQLLDGVAHKVPRDLRDLLTRDSKTIDLWNSLTPLARNEYICWIISPKQKETRVKHVRRTKEELLAGKRRPCCWVGCIHRSDKPMSASQKWVTGRSK